MKAGMSAQVKDRSAARRFAPAGVLFAALGVALFAYFVWRAGPWEIWANARKIGAGFALIIFISGLRFAVRSWAWTLCFEPPHRLRWWDAFKAFLIGDTAGNVVPLGLVVSEPAKVAAVRERVPVSAALPAIAVENLFYVLSVALFIFAGASALLLSFPLPKVLRWSSVGVVVGVVVVLSVALLAARRQWKLLSAAFGLIAARGAGRRKLGAYRERVLALENRIYGFYERNRARLLPILALQACFHALGVAEAFVTIYLISDTPPTLLAAFLFESVNRVINVVFKFVPLRAGVDEAGTGALATALKFGVAAGVTLAVVRKTRMVFWMGVGVLFLVMSGLSLRAVTEEAKAAREAADKKPGSASEEKSRD